MENKNYAAFGLVYNLNENVLCLFDPSVIGYKFDDENPRIQLEPIGARGYIELLPIK